MSTSSEISVTTNIIITASPSIWMPALSLNVPLSNHVVARVMGSTAGPSALKRPTARPRAPSAEVPSALRRWLIHWIAAPTDSTNDAPTAAMPTSDPLRGRRLPNNKMTANDSAGMSGTSHALSRNHIVGVSLVLQQLESVEIGLAEGWVRQ